MARCPSCLQTERHEFWAKVASECLERTGDEGPARRGRRTLWKRLLGVSYQRSLKPRPRCRRRSWSERCCCRSSISTWSERQLMERLEYDLHSADEILASIRSNRPHVGRRCQQCRCSMPTLQRRYRRSRTPSSEWAACFSIRQKGAMFLHRGNKIAEAKVICSTVPQIAGNRDICRIGGVRVYIQHSAHIPPGREGLFNMIKGFPDDFCSRMGLWSPMATTCCSTAGLAASGCRRVGSWFPHVRRQVAERRRNSTKNDQVFAETHSAAK